MFSLISLLLNTSSSFKIIHIKIFHITNSSKNGVKILVMLALCTTAVGFGVAAITLNEEDSYGFGMLGTVFNWIAIGIGFGTSKRAKVGKCFKASHAVLVCNL